MVIEKDARRFVTQAILDEQALSELEKNDQSDTVELKK